MNRAKWIFLSLTFLAVAGWFLIPLPEAPKRSAAAPATVPADIAQRPQTTGDVDASTSKADAAATTGQASAGPASGASSSSPAAFPSRTSGAPTGGSSGAMAGKAPSTDESDAPRSQPDVAELLAGVDLSNPSERERVALLITEQEEARRQSVVQKARALGVPELVKKPEGGVMEIFDFEGDEPVYRTTFNSAAGISSGADLLRGAGFGNLTGRGLKVGVWDGGSVRPTHQEFGEGQVMLRNPDRAYDDHATHVAATLAGTGFQPDALGMAPEARVDSYFWRNDHGEMILAGAALPAGEAGKIPLSNHSYGIVFMPLSAGVYERLARGNDAVTYGLPYFLQFWAAGNAQERQPDGYFTITHYQLAKNVVTVGAVNDAVGAGGQRDPNAGTMSTFSSWGPARDGRIKPDLVANGVDLYSAVDFSDQSYDVYSGTSMASPSAAGTGALLVELYRRESGGQLPTASLLKALLIHTADDLGRPGPDYQFGWGLINGRAAGELIKENRTSPRFFEGAVSSEARRWTHTFSRAADNPVPVRATLVWTDPPGEVRSAASRNPNLVHNLDLKIVGPDGTEHFPYMMPYVGDWSPAALAADAERGKNKVDNVEQVDIDLPAGAGTYTVVVTADGPMSALQRFSVVLTGTGAAVNQSPVVTLQSPESGDRFLPGRAVALRAAATDLRADGSAGAVARVEFLVDGVKIGEDAAAPYDYDAWVPPGAGSYTIEAVAYDTEGAAGYSNPVVIEVREPLPGELHPAFTPPTADNVVLALAEDEEGSIYIGGLFTRLNGSIVAPRLARLAPDGAVDQSGFVVGGGPNDRVRVLRSSAAHGALYVAGDFTSFNSVPRAALARLHIGHAEHADGTLDEAFNAEIASSHPLIKPSVRAVLLQPDGKIVIGGLFDRVRGVARRNLARLHPDGTLDGDFDPSPNGPVTALALQSDDKILLGGEFTALGGTTRNRLARVDADGSNDAGLVLGTGQQTGFNGPVYALATDDAGNIFAGGAFTAYRGHPYHANLIKLEPDGTLAGYFNFEPGLNGTVHEVLTNGVDNVVVGGAFTEVGNSLLGMRPTPRGRVLRFNSNGSLDIGFNAGGVGADGTVHRMVRLRSGHFLLAGSFTNFNGSPSARLAMLAGEAPTKEEASGTVVSRWQTQSVAGDGMDFSLLAGGEGGRLVQLVGDLPKGLRFDAATGRLIGAPLEAGVFEVRVSAINPAGQVEEGILELSVEAAAVSYEQWRSAWFGPGEENRSGPKHVNNAAGLSNLEVYAFSGGDPRTASGNLLPQARLVANDAGNRLEWNWPKYPLANQGGVTNVIYQPEVATDPRGPWEPTEAYPGADRLRVPTREHADRQFLRIKLFQP